jgi:phosphatidylglycerol---prolipoprotein diacylglyceryl transferase
MFCELQTVVMPHYFIVLGMRIHPHLLFESLAYLISLLVFILLRCRFSDTLLPSARWAAVAFAVMGGALGSKLLYLLEDPHLTWSHRTDLLYLVGGKTIVGALVLGVLFVEMMKRKAGIRESTGDLYAIPLVVGIAVGRIGCFLTGIADNTYGVPTGLPWGVDFGDGVRRHPTQLYEAVFLVGLIPMLYRIIASSSGATRADGRASSTFCAGDAFKVFMIAYLSFRLLCDLIKPYPRIFLNLGAIQWACVAGLLYYSRDLARWFSLRLSPGLGIDTAPESGAE